MIRKLFKNFSGIILIFMMYFAWCCMSVSYNSGLFLVLFVLTIVGAGVLYYVNRERVACGAPSANIFIVIAGSIIGGGAVKEAVNGIERPKHVLVNIAGRMVDRGELTVGICALGFALLGILIIVGNYKQYLGMLKGLKELILKYKWLVILLIITTVLTVDSEWKQFKWDGLLYYQTSATLDITNIGEMGVYGHVAQGFSLIVKAFEYATGSTAAALLLSNIFLFITSICYVYALLRMLITEKKEPFYIAATAIYAFSPFYLGMAGYYNLDFFLMCMLPATVYYAYSKKWIQLTITATLLCFTKEPAVIIYGAFCLGIVICDAIGYMESATAEDKKIQPLLKHIFGTLHYYYMALPGILWILTFEILGPWVGGSHDVGISSQYIIGKLKVFYVLNFNWIFVALIVILLVVGIIRKQLKKADLYVMLPFAVSLVGFTLFNLVFITANHPRYIDSVPYMLYILAAYLAGIVIKDGITIPASYVLAGLMLVQSFYTIDPVSLAAFDRVNIGNATIITTSERIGDSSQYNRQMLGAEPALGEAVAEALDSDSAIIFAAFDETTYTTDGMAAAPVATYDLAHERQYFNKSTKRRTPEQWENSEEIMVYHIAENGRLSDIGPKGTRVSIIYSVCENEQALLNITEQLDVEESVKYANKGFVFYRVTGTVK